MSAPAASAARSLADDLRARSDAQLVALLQARPDLATPVPSDLTSLAARATTRASVQRALDRLDTLGLHCLEALAVLPEPASRAEVAQLLGVRPKACTIGLLRDLALVWGPDCDLRLARAVRDNLGPHPAGLGPPVAELLGKRDLAAVLALARDLGLQLDHPHAAACDPLAQVAAHLSDPAVIADLLQDAPPQSRAVLEQLTWRSPVGALPRADRAVDRQSASTAVEWLLARGLLGVADAEHVVLPKEVALALRGGRLHAEPSTAAPAVEAVSHEPSSVDAAAGVAGAELLRLVEELLQSWGLTPPPVLRSGGLGVRELRRTAAGLQVDEPTAARVVELAYVGGLIADDGQAQPVWAPTPASEQWQNLSPAPRWAVLARAWLGCTRAPGLVGTRDPKGAVRAALSADIERPLARVVRVDVLRELADVGAGLAPQPHSLLGRLHWQRPRQAGALVDELVTWTLAEAELLGVTGRGALSTPGRALHAARVFEPEPAGPAGPDPVADAMGALLPEPVDHVLLQADLTAVAPGQLEPVLARAMALSADVESRGGATVYRFSPLSVRRALDAGWSAHELLELLAARSRTPVPQPLDYLVHDVARRHGQLRVAAAGAYIRSDDESLIGELLAERRVAALRLRRLAPTVLVAQAEPATVLSVLRQAGRAPVAESADGVVVVRRPDSRRTPPRQPPQPTSWGQLAPSQGLLEAVVRMLRAGQLSYDQQLARSARGPGPALTATDPALTLATLRAAAAARERVWIGYADASGHVERRVVEPLSVEGGRVTVFDHGTEHVRSFSVHRVTAVTRADESA